MMDMDQMQSVDAELEEGELSEGADDEIYTPLQRPTPAPTVTETVAVASPLAVVPPLLQIQSALDDESQSNTESSSGESSEEGCIKKLRTDAEVAGGSQKKVKKRIKRTVMVRVPPSDSDMPSSRARFKKYNVWTAALQEDTLSENMRGCDVTRSGNDRNVENYDYSLSYRLNGENLLKRRMSNSSDDEISAPANKRGRLTSRTATGHPQRSSVRSRLGRRSRRGTSSASGSSDSCEPRHILDLEDSTGRDPSDVAREMANKLYEDKDELLIRVVEVLGIEVSTELYKETQRIEADGGMMIKTGKRRRTPGGVFLFLLKHDNKITIEQQKSIFAEDRQNASKSRKQIENLMRDRKVEELKKCLSKQGTELPSLNSRKDLYMQGAESSAESQPGNLSNPPPSPVGHDQGSPERPLEITINHVDNVDEPSTSKAAGLKELVSYDDDFLDVNCGEMDFF